MYRVVVAEGSYARDGRFVEVIGHYDPQNKIEGKQLTINLDRAAYWVGVGAQPSDTVRTLINRVKRSAKPVEAAKA
jgi:small subunit ribosomal protein S16